VRFSPEAMGALSRYRWPGNVRELANLIERLAVLHPSGQVRLADLPARYRVESDGAPPVAAAVEASVAPIDAPVASAPSEPRLDELPPEGLDLKEHMARIETALIKAALERSAGVVAHAAQLLGLRRTTLVEKLRKYGLGRGEDGGMDEVA
jgi:sigma-54 specific flagellar transcriptional regulator A